MQLKGTSSWVNLITKRDQQTPAGWAKRKEETGAH